MKRKTLRALLELWLPRSYPFVKYWQSITHNVVRSTMIDIRKLAAADMAGLGTRLIVAEYALGIVLPVILGLISIRSGLFGRVQSGWETALGCWLVSIAANYVPLFIYAVFIARGGTVKQEGQPELAHAKRYTVQSVIILVPFLVLVLALVQQGRRPQQAK